MLSNRTFALSIICCSILLFVQASGELVAQDFEDVFHPTTVFYKWIHRERRSYMLTNYTFEVKSETKYVPLGQNVSITCEAAGLAESNGYKVESIIWFFHGNEIFEIDPEKVKKENDGRFLFDDRRRNINVTWIQKNDSLSFNQEGFYDCHVLVNADVRPYKCVMDPTATMSVSTPATKTIDATTTLDVATTKATIPTTTPPTTTSTTASPTTTLVPTTMSTTMEPATTASAKLRRRRQASLDSSIPESSSPILTSTPMISNFISGESCKEDNKMMPDVTQFQEWVSRIKIVVQDCSKDDADVNPCLYGNCTIRTKVDNPRYIMFKLINGEKNRTLHELHCICSNAYQGHFCDEAIDNAAWWEILFYAPVFFHFLFTIFVCWAVRFVRKFNYAPQIALADIVPPSRKLTKEELYPLKYGGRGISPSQLVLSNFYAK